MRLPALFRTSVFQLTLIYITLFGVSVAALFLFMYWSTVGFLERQTNEVIDAEITGLDEQYQRRGLVGLVDVLRERVRRPSQERSVYLLVDAALHRAGITFPETPYRFLIETEGFGAVLRDHSIGIVGLPNVEVIHADA